MEMKKAAYGPSGPKISCANEGPHGPSEAFFGPILGFMAEIAHNFLLSFKNSAIFLRPTVIQSDFRS